MSNVKVDIVISSINYNTPNFAFLARIIHLNGFGLTELQTEISYICLIRSCEWSISL